MTLFKDWAHCKPFLLEAIERSGTHTPDDVAIMLGARVLTLWRGEKSAIVTEWNNYPQARHLHVFLCGGDLSELLGMVPLLEKACLDGGGTGLTACGRLGWSRVLPQHGWENDAVQLSKKVLP